MANQVQPARQSERSTGTELTLAELMDPVALEARLATARARRAEALARRREESDAPASSLAVTRVPRPAEATEAPSRHPAPTPRTVAEKPNVEARKSPPPAQPPLPAVPVLAAEAPVVPRTAKTAEKPSSATGAFAQVGTVPVLLLAILVGLLGGGAAVLLAPPSFRQHVADRIAPTRDSAPEAPDTASPSAQILTPDFPRTDRAAVEPAPSTGAESGIAAMTPSAPTRAEAEIPPRTLGSVAAAPAPDTVAAMLGTVVGATGAPTLAPDLPSAPPPFAPTELAPATPDKPAVATEPSQPPAAAGAPQTAPPPRLLQSATNGTRVYVHFPPSAAATAAATVDALRAAGVAEARALPAAFPVAGTNVRFYHPGDRTAAESVSRLLGVDQPDTRDFTDFRPQPAPGVVEIWLGGTMTADPVAAKAAPAAPAHQVARRATTGGASSPRPAQAELAAQQARSDAVQQIIVRRAVERMLREQLDN